MLARIGVETGPDLKITCRTYPTSRYPRIGMAWESRNPAIAAAMAGLLLLAVAYHVGSHGGERSVLIKRDRFGIPEDGSDNAHPSLARTSQLAVAVKTSSSSRVIQGLEAQESSLTKVLEGIQSEVHTLAAKVTQMAEPAPQQSGSKQDASPKQAPVAAAAMPAPEAAPAVPAAAYPAPVAAAAAKVMAAASAGIKQQTLAAAVDAKKQAAGRLLEKAKASQAHANPAKNLLLQDLLKNGGIVMPPAGATQETALLRMQGEIQRALGMVEGGSAKKLAAVASAAAHAAAVPPVAKAGRKAAPLHSIKAASPRGGGAASVGQTSRQEVDSLAREVSVMEERETSLLDDLPAAEDKVKRDKVGVANTRQTLSISKDRLALARRAVEDAESSGDTGVDAMLLSAQSQAAEAEARVSMELGAEERELQGDVEAAARAPELARVLAKRRKEMVRARLRLKMEKQLQEAQSLMNNRNFAG